MIAPAAAQVDDQGGEIRVVRAENGLRIATKEAFAKDLVALNLYVDGGNRTETAPLSGLSHYYEHLIFRGGTKKQAELETRKHFDAIGQFGGWTSSDVTCYNFVVPAARFDEALDRFADAVMNVEVTAEKVAKEREVVISEFKMSYADSPRGWCWYNLMRAAFRRHPYGRTTIGLREVIETAELDRFKTFYAARYVPNHMVIAVVGAIPHEAAAAKVARAFAGFKPGRDSFETGEAEPAADGLRSVVERKKTEKSYAALGFRAPGAMAKDAYAVSLLAHILGGGESSRLEREVRAKQELVLDAGAWFDDNKDPSLLGVAFSCEPGKELGALGGVAREAARLRDGEVAPEELARAKVALETGYLFGNESVLQQANRICWFAVVGEPKLGADHVAKIRAVTAGDVREAARRYLVPKAATVSLILPEGESAGPPPAADAIAAAFAEPLAATSTATAAAAPVRERTLTRRLENSAFLIAREDRSAPIVAVSLRFVDPLDGEPAARPGIAALGDRLLMRGAGGFSREELAARIDGLGVRIGTSIDHDALSGGLEAPADRFGAGLDLLVAVLLVPAFDAAEIEKARTEQIAAIQAIEDDSFSLVARAHYAALDPDTLYGRPVEGTIPGVRSAPRDDIVAWHRAAIRPDRLIVAVVGAIDPSSALDALSSRFSRLRPPSPSPSPAPAPAPALALAPALGPRLVDKKREQVCFRLGHLGIAPTHPDWIPLAIAVRYLGSQIFFRYVYENGMAYRAWTYLSPGRRPRPFTYEMGVSAPNFAKARDGLTQSLREFVAKGLDAGQLAKAKSELVSRHLLNQQTDGAQAGLLVQYESLGVGWKRMDELPALVEATTLEAVNAAIKKHLDPDRLTLAVVGDLDAAGIAPK